MANIRLRLLRSGLLVAFIYVFLVHARFLKEALTELTDPQWGENLDEPILLSSTQNGSNSPVLDLETHEIKSDAPFTFAACMLVMDDNKVRKYRTSKYVAITFIVLIKMINSTSIYIQHDMIDSPRMVSLPLSSTTAPSPHTSHRPVFRHISQTHSGCLSTTSYRFEYIAMDRC